ncbi:HD domain-containing phosphohydrolase [Thalassotalea profundi]|uniref:3'3'-cGAMP-specific phosphodiesterase 2 n=1 Tax=Thalassotalea profundi TaxID=2036687 RepID=A0ABQ3IZT2_9GAMM|nr:HD domain-containing phosphohydrolase [Thalassotalea profundi]GHE98038.1 3'3'-cGAMP-specific phosphodiesterase 2 [Thalassotalea profundi]
MSMFVFKDEEPIEKSEAIKTSKKLWRVLIVDDDEAVHQITKLVLLDAIIENRRLEMVSAYSSKEAQDILNNDDSFCMAFVDVVMETDHAGLELVDWIRNTLKNQAIRLILRTGQAGTAPEAKVIKEFDINDYKEKTDFTSNKMITTVYAAIRAYRDIITIQRSLDAFKQLIKSTHDLLRINQFKSFGSAALNNLLTLMDLDSSALYIARNQIDYDQQSTNFILACTGKYVSESDDLDSSEIDENIKQLIRETFDNKSHFSNDDCFIGYYETASNVSSVLYIEFEDDNEHFRSNLVELFATNVALILESLTKQHEIERTQKELIYIVGDAIEARCKETGQHVHRVALVCELLAIKLGLPSEHVRAIRLAAPLHDIGKIIVPESVVQKPGKLDAAEWLIMKQHTEKGSELLSKSKANISKLGAKMAMSHHENWDGSGYPEGLIGEAIPLEARIMAIADVYDSLRSTRSYKDAWDDEQIKTFFIEQKGKKFEPSLVELFLEHYGELGKIQADWI